MLRLTSSLARCRLCFPVISTSIQGSRCGFCDVRFLSTLPRRPLRPLAARRREREDDSSVAKEAQGEDGGEGGNGRLILKEKTDGQNGRVVPTELHKEATEAYMAYAMSVLLGRALPDVRDGLKPVHRRIL